jgi:hypothetical protein
LQKTLLNILFFLTFGKKKILIKKIFSDKNKKKNIYQGEIFIKKIKEKSSKKFLFFYLFFFK